MKSQRITKVITVYPEGTMNVCTKFHDSLLNSCWDISVWTKAADRPTKRPTNQHGHPQSHTVSMAKKFWSNSTWYHSLKLENFEPQYLDFDMPKSISDVTTGVCLIIRVHPAWKFQPLVIFIYIYIHIYAYFTLFYEMCYMHTMWSDLL